MKKFIIEQFQLANNFNVVYTLEPTTGLYVRSEADIFVNQKRGIFDFLTGGYIISRVNIPGPNNTRLIYQKNEVILNNDAFRSIINFKTILNKLQVTLSNGDIVSIDQISKRPLIVPAMHQTAPLPAQTVNQIVLDYKKIEEISKVNVNNREVRLSATLKKRKESPLEFVKLFFTDWNQPTSEKMKNTIYVDDETIQTENNKRRSFGDIYQILKYYYPDITVKEVISIMYRDIFKEIPNLRTSYCGQTNKRMFYYSKNCNHIISDKTMNDENGYKWNDYINSL